MGLLVAGTKYRGEFEERLKKLMEEIKQNSDIILVRARRPGPKSNLNLNLHHSDIILLRAWRTGLPWQELNLQHAQAGTLGVGRRSRVKLGL